MKYKVFSKTDIRRLGLSKRLVLLTTITMVAYTSWTQETVATPCGTTEHMESEFEKHPEYKIIYDSEQLEFQDYYESFQEEYSGGSRAVKIIPVVVHILHTGGPENISDEQVRDAIKQLNEDFSATNEDISTVVPAFTPIIGDMEVEFRLAGKDINGDCHKGITRTYSEFTHGPHDDDLIIGEVQSAHGNWPQNRYMNVFVCATIGGAAGYTNYPSSWYSETGMKGGIFMLYTYMGSIEASNEYKEHTLSHEAGHWLNLPHLWGSTNTPGDPDNCLSDDGVSDTPNTEGWTFCDTDGITCGSLDNVQNFMEYSYCGAMFTEGQVARSQAALNSSLAGRNNLWSASNITNTGTDGILCAAEFTSDATVVCVGESIQFNDDSYHQITARNWSFEGGTPNTSTDENPLVYYDTPGTYAVSLGVWNGPDEEWITRTNYITVFDSAGVPLPYFEGFETMNTIYDNNRFAIYNENNEAAWEITEECGALSQKCVWLDNFDNNDGSFDNMIAGTIDLSTIDTLEPLLFTFDYAYNRRHASDNEELRFYISNDCGQSWKLRAVYDSHNLTEVVNTSPFIAIYDAYFKKKKVTTITPPFYVKNFQYMFRFQNDDGNNIFLDNIRLYPASMTDLEDEVQGMFSIYPSPTSNTLTLETNGYQANQVQIYDMTGRLIQGLDFQSTIDVAGLASGMYHIHLLNEEGRIVAKERFVKK